MVGLLVIEKVGADVVAVSRQNGKKAISITIVLSIKVGMGQNMLEKSC